MRSTPRSVHRRRSPARRLRQPAPSPFVRRARSPRGLAARAWARQAV